MRKSLRVLNLLGGEIPLFQALAVRERAGGEGGVLQSEEERAQRRAAI